MPASSEARFQVYQGQAPVEVRFEWSVSPRLWVAGEEVRDPALADGSTALGWHLAVPWDTLGTRLGEPFALRSLKAATSAHGGMDEGTGADITFTPTPAGYVPSVAALRPGTTVEGPGLAGGASITLDARGTPLVAYYIYDNRRDVQTGVYLATIDVARQSFKAERISGVALGSEGRDSQMRTQVAHDGTSTFVLFTDDPAVDNYEDGPGHPGTPDSVYVLARSGSGWVREDPTPGGRSDVGPEDVPDLAARDGRLVAAARSGTAGG
ncbi:MAG TPA: hypothetical protein VFH47_06860 [Candidatus Thermoplasmatota archaeon]|nr:hypothetical protein [Candidatus Thermoplasmatota archaeon]